MRQSFGADNLKGRRFAWRAEVQTGLAGCTVRGICTNFDLYHCSAGDDVWVARLRSCIPPSLDVDPFPYLSPELAGRAEGYPDETALMGTQRVAHYIAIAAHAGFLLES